MTRYVEMVDVGYDWLPPIPAHWEIKPFRRIFEESSEVNGADPVGVMLSVSGYRGVEPKKYDHASQMRAAEMLETYRVVRPGQLAVNTMWLNYAGLGISEHLGYVSPAYRSYWVRAECDGRYLHHLLRSEAYVKGYTGHLRGIRPNSLQMDRDTLMRWPILLPSVPEQGAIADYLDRETAQMDTLIEEQQLLIEMLQERRVAVVDSLLTTGVNSDVPQIATGTSWIPTLPRGWQAIPAKRVLSFGPSNGVSPEAGDAGGVKSLSLAAIRDGRVSAGPDVTKVVDRTGIANIEDYRLYPNDILLVRGNGNVDLVARAGLVGAEFATDEYIYPDLLIRVRVNSSMLPEFFVWACNATATRAQVRAQARTAVGTFKVAGGMVQSLVLPLPPLDEQRRIVAHLDEQTAKIDSLIAETERFIELSRERRSALITAAVTGQIDVREVA
ncbi:restriction modification system DNA specificity domain-containing protein [Mycolicibacterium cyprinidarum]|uniref:Restriction modification system DNA specificity domain-containing protein n=1 Tax=Mycolicibacterium cyprinidarum TaxID=2860311 RepID=A0ABQ4V817_9MYCO|nr:restriction modification system DNA specificity domain-containing protein [Mycolicibacterium sp. NGTWSNA01]GJF17500.1 restriction modification system DNA specificity domain-containing protein [Mycolicibacterium sp. NGTWS0302]